MIRANLEHIHELIGKTALDCGRDPETIKLVAVSKRFPVEAIIEARAAGHLVFGENYLQEAAEKKAVLGDSVRLHFIGHLQSNKARTAAEIFDMIETVDRIKIAAALNRHLLDMNRTLDILVQVNVGLDPRKAGVLPDKAEELVEKLHEFNHLRLRGLMTIPPLSAQPEDSRPYFRSLRRLGENLQAKGLLTAAEPFELSMGMSDDYRIAIEEGATLIRIGTAIFGRRPAQP